MITKNDGYSYARHNAPKQMEEYVSKAWYDGFREGEINASQTVIKTKVLIIGISAIVIELLIIILI